MTQIRVRIAYHNPARPERVVSKLLEISRDLVADPIEVDEVLHLDNNCAENLVVSGIQATDPITVESRVVAYGMNEDLKATMAAADGWTIER